MRLRHPTGSWSFPSANPPRHSPRAQPHVELEGLQHSAVAPGDGREQAHDLLDDAVQVVQPTERAEAQRALAGAAAAVQDALGPQLLPQLLQHGRMLQQLHDERGAGAGGGGVGGEDELQRPVLQKQRSTACNLGSAWWPQPGGSPSQPVSPQAPGLSSWALLPPLSLTLLSHLGHDGQRSRVQPLGWAEARA